MSELNNIALKIIASGKGILAADESTATMTKRLENIKIESNSKNRLLFRETLFSSSGMKDCIGGVILYDETIRQITTSENKIPEPAEIKNAVTLETVSSEWNGLVHSPKTGFWWGPTNNQRRFKVLWFVADFGRRIDFS